MALKRKADTDSESPSSKKAKVTTTKPAPKAPKKAPTTRKGRDKKNVEPEEPPKPRVKRINKILKAKVRQVLDFVDNNGRETSRLKRNDDNENHVIVPEAVLLASLMAMRADWEVTDPRMASLLDASEVIVEQYEEKWVTSDQMVRFVVVDLDKETSFVGGVHQKVEGLDLEAINLLEVELELTTKQAEDAASLRLFSAAEPASQADGASNGTVAESDAAENTVGSPPTNVENDQVKEGDEGSISVEKESGREGVCPAPAKEV